MPSIVSAAQDRRTKLSKRAANSYPSEEWKRHQTLITRLYSREGRTLREVRELLERNYKFSPTARMYKSRLHAWGLDKKKKEHEMLEVVRQAMVSGGDNKNKVSWIRGRPVTLAEALHYFDRKGVKNPANLLKRPRDAVSKDCLDPNDSDSVDTLLSAHGSMLEGFSRSDPESDLGGSSSIKPIPKIAPVYDYIGVHDFAERAVVSFQVALGLQEIKPMPVFRLFLLRSVVPPSINNPKERWYVEAILRQILTNSGNVFQFRKLLVSESSWTATSAEVTTDKGCCLTNRGFAFWWDRDNEEASETIEETCTVIEGLIKDNHVALFIYVLDLTIRHDGSDHGGFHSIILQHLASLCKTPHGSETSPTYLVVLWLTTATISRASVAVAVMRKLLDHFQDSVGYFHLETIALLQIFAVRLLNNGEFAESAVRFQQLVGALETTQGKQCYQVCNALRRISEAYFYNGEYSESLQAIKAVLERSRSLPHHEEREMYVRCLGILAELSGKLHRREEAIDIVQHMLDTTITAFGEGHAFVPRARTRLNFMQSCADPDGSGSWYRMNGFGTNTRGTSGFQPLLNY